MGKGRPHISVVIATRNRGGRVVETVQSVLANEYPAFEVWVIDQSDDLSTQHALKPVWNDSRFHYRWSDSQGVSLARNFGIQNARGEIIAISDDDCWAPSDWLFTLAGAFDKDRRIVIVFGNVEPGSHNHALGFIPTYNRKKPFLARTIADKLEAEGLSACMGLRRDVWKTLNGFDEMLGAGAPLRSGAEGDFTIRAMRAGHMVYETPTVYVVHNGFRPWEEAQIHSTRCWYGTGALYAKSFKLKPLCTANILSKMVWRKIVGSSRYSPTLSDSPSYISQLRPFVAGFVAGMFTPVSRTSGHYISPDIVKL